MASMRAYLALFRWGGRLETLECIFLISLGVLKAAWRASLCMSGFTFDCTNQIFKPSKPSANIIPFCSLYLRQCTSLTPALFIKKKKKKSSASYSSYFYDFCSMCHYQKLEMGVSPKKKTLNGCLLSCAFVIHFASMYSTQFHWSKASFFLFLRKSRAL